MRKFYKYLLLPSGKAHEKITKKYTIDKILKGSKWLAKKGIIIGHPTNNY